MPSRAGHARRSFVVLAVLVALLGGTLTSASASRGVQATGSSGRPLVEREVSIPAGDHNIPATLTRARVDGRIPQQPAVLLVHGFASSRDEVGGMYERVARALAKKGYASLRIDFAGSGDSSQPFVENTFDGMVSDTEIALDWLVGLQTTDDERIGILGFSLGSRIAAVVAGTDSRVSAFASWSGAVANGRTNFESTFDAYYDSACPDGSAVVDLGFRVVELSCDWFETMEASTAQEAIGGFSGPLLAIAGTEDTVVDPIWSKQVVLDSDSLDATVRTLPGADHIFLVLTPDQTLANQVIRLTSNWFAGKL